MLTTFNNWVSSFVSITPKYQNNIIDSIAVGFIIFFTRWCILRITDKYDVNLRTKYRISKTSSYVATILMIIIVGQIWLKDNHATWDVSTFFGLLSAGIAVALKDPIANIAGWLFILWKRPFEVGDRIQVGEEKGDVIDQRIFMFTVLEIGNWVDADQSTGRVIHIPNARIFQQTLASYTKGFEYIWNEIPVLITFESDWKKAKQILLDISHEHGEQFTKPAEKKMKNAAKRFMIYYKNLTPIVYTSVKECGVMLTIRYLTEPRKRRNSEQEIWEEILTKFSEHKNIDFAYPTTRFYNNLTEGKDDVVVVRPNANT